MNENRDYPASGPDMANTESEGLQCWQRGGQWFRYGEHAVFSRIAGEGEVLLLLHGFPTASWDWHRLWPALTERYRVMVADMLGFGFSDKPQNYPYSIIDQADLQQGWLEAMGVERVHILAHDYGATVAQELLARDQQGELPFTLASVCLLNGAIFPEVHRPIALQKLLLGPLGGLISLGLTRRVFEYNLCKVFGRDTQPSPADLEDFWQLLVYNNGRSNIHRLIHYMEERRCHRHRWVGALQWAIQPLGLVWGEADPVSGQPMLARYRELVGEEGIMSIPGIGHYPHVEAPGAALQCYLRFRDAIAADHPE